MQPTDKEYVEHEVFSDLATYMKFYRDLSTSIFQFATMGTTSLCNIDTYTYSSIEGTIDSIRTTLLSGRINDSYSLLRKYYDSAIINIYSNLYLKENFNIENFLVQHINDWLHGKAKLPEYRLMSQYLKSSKTLSPIYELFFKDDRYKLLRNRCNDHTHYNFYKYMMLNDNEIYIKDRGIWLNKIRSDMQDIFILHLGCIFFINDHYMMSSDHLDALEAHMEPEKNSQYWVSPFIQDIFDKVITPHRPDIVTAIKNKTVMHLS